MTALRYIGGGTFIHGVPARDLTEDEAALYGATIRQQETAAHVTMYEAIIVAQAPVEPAAPAAGKRTSKEGDNGS